MSAYLVFDIDVKDPEAYKEYVRIARPTVAQFGGRVLALSDDVENLEGAWNPRRVVIIEFDNADAAKAWVNSPDYGRAKPIRHRTAQSNVVIVPGLK